MTKYIFLTFALLSFALPVHAGDWSVELTGASEPVTHEYLHVAPVQAVRLRGAVYGEPAGDINYKLYCDNEVLSSEGKLTLTHVTPPVTFINGMECNYAKEGYHEPHLVVTVSGEEHFDFLPVYYQTQLPALVGVLAADASTPHDRSLLYLVITSIIATCAYLIFRLRPNP